MITKIIESSQFDSIRHFDESGNEYWTGRELMPLLGYSKWQRFEGAIARAKVSLQNTNGLVEEHFSYLPGAVSWQGRFGDNYRLSRHACYLVAMNGDFRKPEIAAAQSYFAITKISESSQFDSIRHFDESENEYWSARQLMPLLGYSKWQRFEGAIARAKVSLQNTNSLVEEHFIYLPGAVSWQGRFGDNYRLSRHACYLVAMNGDSRKPEIAAAQSYFAMKLTAYEYLLQAGFGIKSDVFDFNNFGSQSSVDTSGFVYLIQSNGTNFFKIGYSKKLLARIKNIQVGNPFKIALVHRVFSLNAPELERSLHKYYTDYLVRGEWYELTSSMVRNFPAIAADLDMRIEYDLSRLERLFLTEES